MQSMLERGALLLALGAALIAIVVTTMFMGARGKSESRAFSDAQYVSAGTEEQP